MIKEGRCGRRDSAGLARGCCKAGWRTGSGEATCGGSPGPPGVRPKSRCRLPGPEPRNRGRPRKKEEPKAKKRAKPEVGKRHESLFEF